MSIRKSRTLPTVVPKRVAKGHVKTKAKSGKSPGVSTGGSTKGSGQVKSGTSPMSVDQVDHADPDQKRGRQQFQQTQGPAETLASSAKKAVGSDGNLRRAEAKDQLMVKKDGLPDPTTKVSTKPTKIGHANKSDKGSKSDKANKSRKGTANIADDDDDGPAMALKAAKVAASNANKTGGAQAKVQNKLNKAGGTANKGNEVKSDAAPAKGKAAGGHARVERGSSGERLEANEKVSIAVEGSGSVDGAAGVEGTGDVGPAVATAGVVAAAAVAGEVALGSEGGAVSLQGQGEIQRAGDGAPVEDAKFQAAVKDVPKSTVVETALSEVKGSELEKPLADIASGQLESDIQSELSAEAADSKQPGATHKESPFDDVASSIEDEGGPLDGVLGDDASRAKAAKKGLPFVKGDGTRRGIDAPVEKAVADMAAVAGPHGVDASDIASNTTKLGGAEDGEADEGEIDEEEDDGDEED